MNNRSPDPFEESEQSELNRLLLESLPPIAPPPGSALRQRLTERVARSLAGHADLLTVRSRAGTWRSVRPGLRSKVLWRGSAGSSVLLEIAPGAAVPAHRHRWTEEGVVLRGDLQLGDLELGPGDYHVSPAHSRHAPIRSRQGALAYLRGTALGHTPSILWELLGGLLPFSGAPARTVFACEGEWEALGPGLWKQPLWSQGPVSSSFYRLEAGARIQGHSHPLDEECLMVSGELFLGDILLQAGDYQLAPAGSRHGPAYSDTGALLFVWGANADSRTPASTSSDKASMLGD